MSIQQAKQPKWNFVIVANLDIVGTHIAILYVADLLEALAFSSYLKEPGAIYKEITCINVFIKYGAKIMIFSL